jgi:hypothetical protein
MGFSTTAGVGNASLATHSGGTHEVAALFSELQAITMTEVATTPSKNVNFAARLDIMHLKDSF